MKRSNNLFVLLAQQAESGDFAESAELRQQLEPELVHMVRRVVRDGPGHSSIDRCISEEARRVGLSVTHAGSAEGDQLIQAVARTICRTIVDRIRVNARMPDRLMETVRA